MKIKIFNLGYIINTGGLSRGLLMSLLFVLALFSCGESDNFTIKGEIDGNPTMNVRYIYYAQGHINRGVTASHGGKFEIKASSPTPTIVEICDNDYRPMARLYVSNGDNVECKVKRDRPNELQVSGNDVSERWANFLKSNCDKLSGSNANIVIEQFVASHPDDIVSTLLMLTAYDSSDLAIRADSVMSTINPEQRPSMLVDGFNSMLQRLVDSSVNESISSITYYNTNDSLITFRAAAKPMSLLVLSDDRANRSDSIRPVLKRLSRAKFKPTLQIVDLSMDLDTIKWHHAIAADSARWNQGWVAASIASPGIARLGIPALPYYIVIDSTGTQLLRTEHIGDAEHFLNNL